MGKQSISDLEREIGEIKDEADQAERDAAQTRKFEEDAARRAAEKAKR